MNYSGENNRPASSRSESRRGADRGASRRASAFGAPERNRVRSTSQVHGSERPRTRGIDQRAPRAPRDVRDSRAPRTSHAASSAASRTAPSKTPREAPSVVPNKAASAASTAAGVASSVASAASAAANTAGDMFARATPLVKRFFSNKRLVLIAAIALVLLILIVWYAGGAAKYRTSYYPNTTAFGTSIGDMTPDEVQALADEKLAQYSLHVTGSSLDVTIPGNELGAEFTSRQSAQDILNQQSTAFWPLQALLPHDMSAAFNIDYNKNSLLGALQLETGAANNAVLSAAENEVHFNTQTKQWVYEATQAGTVVDVEQLARALDEPLRALQTEFAVPAQCVKQVEIAGTSEQKQAAANRANELCAAYNLTFTLGEATPFVVDAAVAATWITISDAFDVSIDAAKVDAWLDIVRALLSDTDERSYTRPDGKLCTVTGGTYGWRAQDIDAAMATIEAGLESGYGAQIPCSREGVGFLGLPGADWGKRYIDVDMDEQYARFYDETGTIIWESDVITGVWGTEFATPTGVYTITEKRSPAQLRSVGEYRYVDENGDTQVDPNHVFGRDVDYWMPFIGSFIGLHDAWWQTDFGGELYKDAALGSGGCVNLPPDKAAELYQIIAPGDVVVTHN